MNKKQIEKQESIEDLKSYLQKGMTLQAIIRQVSNSGMSRNISFKLINSRNEIIDLSYQIAKALEYPFNDKYHAVKVKGCGMDMAFHVTYNISHMLFNDGYQVKSNIL
tara:strand:- start:5 stop:328 length:324 start_codon:yes stop_codon:yes gene_type:complete